MLDLTLTCAIGSLFAYKNEIDPRILKKNLPPKYNKMLPLAFIDKRCWVFRDDATNTMMVAFRGSDTIDDLAQSLKFYPIPLKRHDPEVKVHAGFLEYYDAIRDDVLDTILEFSDENDTLAIAGHSLGGCAAMIASLEIAQLRKLQLKDIPKKTTPTSDVSACMKDEICADPNSSQIYCVTFAMPALGNQAFCDSFNALVPNYKRYVCGADMAPRFPIPGLKHARTGIYLPAPRWSGVRDTIAHHNMSNYLQPLRSRARNLELKRACLSPKPIL